MFEILISCMHKRDFRILKDSNIHCNALIINQTDKNETLRTDNAQMICTTERGLSKSRNMAVSHTAADICLLSDDDEVFVDGIDVIVQNAYEKIPNADIIIFKMINYPTSLGNKIRPLKMRDLLKVSSWQISFKTDKIKGKIRFDENIGAGTNNGGGEENKFLMDCYKGGLKIYYYPQEIASVAQNESTWFHGYDDKFFYIRGANTRYIFGLKYSLVYALYYALTKRKLYRSKISTRRALSCLYHGIKDDYISKENSIA